VPAYPYPVNLDLDGRPVLVVGGGRVAFAKATGPTQPSTTPPKNGLSAICTFCRTFPKPSNRN